MTNQEWEQCLFMLDECEKHIADLEPESPNPSALRCVHSRHRTLAHIRACQETWLAACVEFQNRSNPSLKLLHPWRVFDRDDYASISWEVHLAAYRSDRVRLREFIRTADRTRGGKINANPHTIEGLVSRIAAHEHYHLFNPR